MAEGEKQILTGQEIKEIISSIVSSPEMCGFEVYIIVKSEPRLKKMGFVEYGTDNLYYKLKESILKILSEKYNSEESEYVSADRIADEKRKILIISTSDDYNPMAVLKDVPGKFVKADISDSTGIAFSIRHGETQIWAYQHLWSIMIPNKSNKNRLARIVSGKQGDVFEEFTDPIISFAEKIDMLVINDFIITSDYKLLQNYFGFQDYIRIRADKTIEVVESKGIVKSIDKLKEYVKRGNGKPKYAKKLMRISDSKVLKMETTKLWKNIHQSSRWNGKLKEDDGQFVLEHYTDVELLIDLLDERYTRSDITGEEYDTEVKVLAEPVS